jgi:hypothetical protein
MVKSLSTRLTENLSALKTNSNINALIVVNSQAISDFVRREFGRLGTGNWNTGGQFNNSAYQAGVKQGKSIQFRKGVSGYGGNVGPKLLGG